MSVILFTLFMTFLDCNLCFYELLLRFRYGSEISAKAKYYHFDLPNGHYSEQETAILHYLGG